jgi:SAM-dependent methyltransferase
VRSENIATTEPRPVVQERTVLSVRARRAAATFARQLLLVDRFNRLVFSSRFLWYLRVRRAMRVHADETAVVAHRYSIEMLRRGKTSNRPLRLIRPLSVIDAVPKDGRVLSVGCRYETELLYLVAHGFSPRNVRGLDMISYSPWIDVGNMHEMPYADSTWDAVILGWVLAYSDAPARAAEEALRVCRDRGVIAVAVSYYPQHHLDDLAAAGTIVGSASGRIQTVDAILGLFGDAVDDVFFRHDAPDPDREGACAVVFSVKKRGEASG